MQDKRQIQAFFLVGPTAVGKSAVAEWIASHSGYHLLSADSMMVYRGMNIGTAKPSAEVQSRIKYHGLDIVEPDSSFNVWSYREHALSVLNAMDERNTTVVVGGTGLYVKALTHGMENKAGPDEDERRKWLAIFREKGVAGLQSALRRLNADAYESLRDKQNWRRLIRKLETCRGNTESSSCADSKHGRWDKIHGKSGLVGLTRPPEELNRRIEKRVKFMFREGLIEETRELLLRYGVLSDTARQAIGYSEAISVIKGSCTLAEAEAQTVTRTRQLAKKQRTWLRHQAEVEWVDLGSDDDPAAAASRVMDIWRKHGPTEITV